MSRLTYKSESGMTWFVDEEGRRLEPCEMSPHHSRLAIEKLAHYEDLEEAGRLIELPCKVGTDTYCILARYNFKRRESEYYIEVFPFEADMLNGMGENFFLTKAEAEAKLEEMERANE